MKIAFFGTGEFSKNILSSILGNSSIEIKLVISQPDKTVGRKKILTKTPIKLLVEEKGIEIQQPNILKNNTVFFEYLKNLKLDFIVVVAYGKIIPNEILDIPKYGCINIHGSILPLYRGASPIQEAIKNGDTKTGLTIMNMSEGMDEGDSLKIKEINIDKQDKTIDIFKKFEKIGGKLLITTLKQIIEGKIKGVKQDDEKVTYCTKIKKIDGEISFSKETAKNIFNKYRAYHPWPGIYTLYNGKKLNIEECSFDKILDFEKKDDNILIPGMVVKIDKKNTGIVCKDKKILIIKQIKLEGKKSMDINSFINGNKNFLNYKF